MNTRWFRNILSVLAIAVVGTGAVCAEIHRAIPFSNHGIIDSTLTNGMMVISDRVFRLSNHTVVHNLSGKHATMNDLGLKTKIGFNVYGTQAPFSISEIWILPSTFDFRSLDED